MGRLNQKSLNMWIPEKIHMEIKQQSNINNLSIKDYILKLHSLQVSSNILQTDEFKTTKSPDKRIDELVVKFDKILKKIETKPRMKTKSMVQQRDKKLNIPTKSQIPLKIEKFISEQKMKNPKFKENNYKETIQAIVKGNHLKKDIDRYRGITFYNTNSKNSEKPLIRLVDKGVLEVRKENEKIPNQKSYYISSAYK